MFARKPLILFALMLPMFVAVSLWLAPVTVTEAVNGNTRLPAFTYGVASGDVMANSAVLWARADAAGTVTTTVATDPAMTNVIYSEAVLAELTSDFTVRARPQILEPATTYFYRWSSGTTESVTGTFKTAPAAGIAADMRIVYSGDSDGTKVGGVPYYNEFEALDAARLEGADFFVYLGDTIYADSGLRPSPAVTLDEYRAVYKENREVSALPELLASLSTYAIWDDHEVMNDYDGQTVDPARYASGRQAFEEYMPLWTGELLSDPVCAGAPLFRTFSWGETAEVIILDLRSCRSADAAPACPFLPGIPDLAPTLPQDIRDDFGLLNVPAGCLEAINDPARTLLGPVQKQAFKDALLGSTAEFKIVINEFPIMQFYMLPYDRWEGYATERAEILHFIGDNGIQNVIFLTADFHANLMNEVFVDNFSEPATVAYEYVTGPVATGTLEQAISSIPVPNALDAVHQIMDIVGMNCRELDAYSYGLVDINAVDGLATISLKDDVGAVLHDSQDPLVSCIATVGYDTYLPRLDGP